MTDQISNASEVFAEDPSDKPYWLKGNEGLWEAAPEDDYLHPEMNKEITSHTLTETQYFGFSVPEANLQSYIYFWHHPNLGVLSGGVYAAIGDKVKAEACEICAYTQFQDAKKILVNDLHSYTMENSLSISVIEPMKKLHMGFEDKARGHMYDLTYTAVSPGILFQDKKHFEQAMKVQGDVMVRGKRYKVDCYSVRDRSWARPRPEDNMPLPPLSWMTGVFDENFSFCFCIFDDPRHQTYLQGTKFELPPERLVASGWIWRDGKATNYTKAWKRVMRDPATQVAQMIEFEVEDDSGKKTYIRGVRKGAHFPITNWNTMIMSINMFEWECEGRKTVGETQEPWYSDYLEAFTPKYPMVTNLPDKSV